MRGLGVIALVLASLPGAALAASNCHVIEYPDHFEAVCNDVAAKTPVPAPRPGGQQTGAVATAITTEPDPVQTDPLPGQVILNGLSRSLGETWLKTLPSGR